MTPDEIGRTNDTINALDLMAHSLSQWADELRRMVQGGIYDMELVEELWSYLQGSGLSEVENATWVLLETIRGPYWYTNDPREED